MPESPHIFVSFPNNRYPRSCVKCGLDKAHAIHHPINHPAHTTATPEKQEK